ncbi:MAG: tetratricopeptide repeat protein [bacterium]
MSEYMQVNLFEDEINRLATILNNSRIGCIIFSLYNTVAGRDGIINRLKDKLKLPIVEFSLTSTQKNPLKLLEQLEPTNNLVVSIYDIEQAFPEVLGYINYQREGFFKYNYGFLFWITEYARDEIANKAADFWSRRSGVFDFRVKDYKQILELRQRLSEEPISYQNKDDLLKKLNIYKNLLEEYKTDKEIDEKNIAKLISKMGQIYYLLGDYDSALKQYQKALEIIERIGDIAQVAKSLHQIGMVYHQRGDYDSALKQYQKALEIDERIGDIAGVAGSLHNIGMIYHQRGDYDSAIKHYQKALEIAERIGDIAGVAKSLHNIGAIYHQRGDYDSAIKHYQKALEITERIGDIAGVAKSLHNIGAIYHQRGDYDSALKQYQKALEIAERIGDVVQVARSLGQIGVLYFDKSDYKRALEFSTQAYSIFEKIGSPDVRIAKGYIQRIKELYH